MKKRLIISAIFMFLIIALDWLKFVILGGPNIVNWQSYIHMIWAIAVPFILLLAVVVSRLWLWRFLAIIYLAIFLASLLNQYFPFTTILTYNCMLFNLFLTMLYFLGDTSVNRF